MVSKLPSSVGRLSLSPSELWPQSDGSVDATNQKLPGDLPATAAAAPAPAPAGESGSAAIPPVSLLRALRKYNGPEGNVCTVEAVVGAVRALGHDRQACDHTLQLAKQKVEVIARYRGKVGFEDT